jgi:hypothetical protein
VSYRAYSLPEHTSKLDSCIKNDKLRKSSVLRVNFVIVTLPVVKCFLALL